MDMTGNETQERRIDERTAKLLQEFGLDEGYDELALRRAFVARLAELGVGGQAASSEDAPLELTDEQSALVRDYQRLRLGLVADFSERSLEGLDSYSAIQRKYEALKPKPPEKKTVVSKVKGFGKAKKAEESTASSAGGQSGSYADFDDYDAEEAAIVEEVYNPDTYRTTTSYTSAQPEKKGGIKHKLKIGCGGLLLLLVVYEVLYYLLPR